MRMRTSMMFIEGQEYNHSNKVIIVGDGKFNSNKMNLLF